MKLADQLCQLRRAIERKNLEDVVRGLPELADPAFRRNQTFKYDGQEHFYLLVLEVEHVHDCGTLLACPDGNVLCQPDRASGDVELWELRDDPKLIAYTLAPFSWSKNIKFGMYTPMERKMKALVLYYMILHAVGKDLTEVNMPFPQTDDLIWALSSLTNESDGARAAMETEMRVSLSRYKQPKQTPTAAQQDFPE